VSRRILEQLHLIMPPGDDPIFMNQNSPNRHLILIERFFGLFQGLSHEQFIH
jgi:hypothetical protein